MVERMVNWLHSLCNFCRKAVGLGWFLRSPEWSDVDEGIDVDEDIDVDHMNINT
jgi:hypothetical protein